MSTVTEQVIHDFVRVARERVNEAYHMYYLNRADQKAVHIEDYMRRVIKTSKATETEVVMAAVYMGRFLHAYPGARFQNGGAHRMFLTCLMLANKVHEDIPCNNEGWARIGVHFTLTEVNTCELEMLGFLQWDLTVMPEDPLYLQWFPVPMADFSNVLNPCLSQVMICA